MRRKGSGAAGCRSGARVSSSSGASRTTAAIAADEGLSIGVQTALLQLPAGLENLVRNLGFPALAQPAAATCAAAAAAGASRGSGRGGGRHRATRSAATSVADVDQQLRDLLDWVQLSSPAGTKCILRIAANGAMLQSLLHATAAAARVPVDRFFSADVEQFVELRCLHIACTLGMEVLRRLPCAATEAGVTAAPFQGLPLMHGFARKLLRMQTLHALSRQTAQALAHVMEATAAASAAGFPTRLRRSLARTVERLEVLLTGCAVVIDSLAVYAFELGTARDGGGGDWSFGGELAAALHDSGLVEHTCRGVLHRLLLPPEAVMAPHGGGEAGGRAADARSSASHLFLMLFQSINTLASDGGAASSVTRLMQQVLSGRCIRTAAQLHGLAALCAADGGPSYGFEPELLRQIPVLAADGSRVDLAAVAAARPSNADPWVICPQLDVMAPLALIASLPDGSDASAPPPPGRRASVRLLLRIVRWTVALMKAADPATIRGGGGSGGSGAGGEPRPTCQPQVLAALAPVDAALVAVRALAHAHPLLEPRAGLPAWVVEVDECWQLTFATARHGMRLAESKQLAAGAARLMMAEPDEWAPPPEHVMALPPPPPTPYQAAALSAGWLPCLELLLRRAAREPHCPEAAAVLQATNPDSPHLVQALAYGNRDQAAALVTTLGKLLWRRLVAADSEGNTGLADAAALADPIYQWALQAVRGVLDCMEAAPPPPEDQQAAAQRQLSDLLSYAAGEWLPPLSRLAKLSLMNADTRFVSGVSQPAGWDAALQPLLRGLPALAARCLTADEAEAAGSGAGLQLAAPESAAAARCGAETPAPEPADSSGTAAAAAVVVAADSSTAESGATKSEAAATTTAAAADSVGGWRRLLFIDMDAAQLLGMVLFASRAFREREGGAGLWGKEETARAHRAVEAACLEELRAGTIDQAGVAALRTLSGELAAATAARGGAGVLPLPPPEEARRRLPRRCANPACTNLDGDSEAELRLQACSGCGEAGYCGRGCQVADWWAGHKEVCSGGRRGPRQTQQGGGGG
ncbi:hypothetical protein PLESTB_001522600 [Pleodorina starrii]|uniref:phytol kinase n=1 Tax=Pleodorina starrii TaxID=330485 RepID=A0A9W6BWS1_9CHLO|nr:hypothetical protein PLESTM_001868500 [Pleodorina starrii]GLC59687.1 hypothetical protein PLESTB_001522600 [Pleodorina starrii]GLC74653.1 hypothetical protein PLESTF_001539800 [Pleodorina starrii]